MSEFQGYILVKIAKLFMQGESQAVRLPKEFRFAGSEVLIKRAGSAVVLLPKGKSWDTLLESLAKFSPDFMTEREQPWEVERRESGGYRRFRGGTRLSRPARPKV